MVQQRTHVRHQSTRLFWKNYAFYVKGGLSDPEVDPRPSVQTVESPQLQSIVVVDISVMAHRQIPMVVEFLQLQYIDKMFDVRCAGPASSGSGRENTVEFPQLQPVSRTWSFTRPLCATTVRCPHAVHRRWSTSSSCRPQQLGLGVDFLGPCTQVQGRGSCPQGHGHHD